MLSKHYTVLIACLWQRKKKELNHITGNIVACSTLQLHVDGRVCSIFRMTLNYFLL